MAEIAPASAELPPLEVVADDGSGRGERVGLAIEAFVWWHAAAATGLAIVDGGQIWLAAGACVACAVAASVGRHIIRHGRTAPVLMAVMLTVASTMLIAVTGGREWARDLAMAYPF